MSSSRASHAAVKLTDGTVLVVGGKGKKLTTEIYDPTADTWTKVGVTEIPHSDAEAIVLTDGTVLLTGGVGHRIAAEIYDPATGEWSRINDMNDTRYRHEMILLDDGKVLVIGGNGIEGLLAETELFTPPGRRERR
jgi:N-acetylneuraminic acid mutarotase